MTNSDKKLVVVFGAAGIQGGSVVESLLNDPKTAATFRIRGITRDTSKPAAQALEKRGVEVATVSPLSPGVLEDRNERMLMILCCGVRPLWTTRIP